ncbi:MAG: hypothetical protein HYZ45_14060 [Burkholderiales bacterium]|nr:hypothetical protein [Burkholderiales bacterium]
MTMKLALQDLIIRLDEKREVIQLLVPKKTGKADDLRAFFEITEDDILNRQELEKGIGATILAFLSATYNSNSFFLDQCRDVGKDFEQAVADDAKGLLARGDADAEFESVMLRINRFNESWLLDDVDGITALLEQSAKNGSKKAAQFLCDEWPALLKIFKKRLGRMTKKD